MNDVDLLSFGSAQLIIVARLIAWRGVRAEASRFGILGRHRTFSQRLMPFLLWGGEDMGVSLFSFTITVVSEPNAPSSSVCNGLPRCWVGRVDFVDRAR